MWCKGKRICSVTVLALSGVLAACALDEHIAPPPIDASVAPVIPDAGPQDMPDGAPCSPGTDTDGDSVEDCAEAGDGNSFTDPAVFNGMTATIGDRPEGTGNCSALDDYAEMLTRFDAPANQAKVYAGWEFDTSADSYDDASYGFQPPWSSAQSGRFSLRFNGRLDLGAGTHCMSIDIGATGTGIVNGRNACGQIYVDGKPAPLVETGYGAAADADTACFVVSGDTGVEIDIVFWYFNVLEQAVLKVRHCAIMPCTPSDPIAASSVQAL